MKYYSTENGYVIERVVGDEKIHLKLSIRAAVGYDFKSDTSDAFDIVELEYRNDSHDIVKYEYRVNDNIYTEAEVNEYLECVADEYYTLSENSEE